MVGISPYKVRLIIDLVRGLPVEDAETRLQYLISPAAEVVLKLVRSAAANAEHNDLQNRSDLFISRITADGGPVLKRYQPRARGRAGSKNRPTSHILVEVNEAVNG